MLRVLAQYRLKVRMFHNERKLKLIVPNYTIEYCRFFTHFEHKNVGVFLSSIFPEYFRVRARRARPWVFSYPEERLRRRVCTRTVRSVPLSTGDHQRSVEI